MEEIRIAIFAYPHYKCPPDGYGPMQEVVTNITKGLAKKNKYNIDVYATADSDLPANIVSVKDIPVSTDPSVPDPKIYEFLSIGELIKNRDKYDIISSHVGFHLLPFAKMFDCPIIVNLQGDYDNKHYYNLFNQCKNDAYFVTISESQRLYLPNLNFAGTVYHGIDVGEFKFNEEVQRERLGFLGRTDPQKGLGDAIKVAINTSSILKIGARKSNTEEAKEYYNKHIKPFIDNKNIIFPGEVSNLEKIKLLNESAALLFPINWNEAFGLVMIESMACGTPVIAYDKGAVSEVVVDGKTGFIIKPGDVAGMEQAVKKIRNMPDRLYKEMRLTCRKHVEENFTVEKMVDGYEDVYKKVITDFKEKNN